MFKIQVKLLIVLSFVVVTTACSSSSDEPNIIIGSSPYFSMESYFKAEVQRLNEQSPTIRKTVMKGEETEVRELTIRSWADELELFVLSDINMEAWIGQYKVDSNANRTEYRAMDPELRTQHIVIYRADDGDIQHIHVANETANMLYKSREVLDYYPDSLYVIEKHQDIRWWSDNTYRIIGEIAVD